MNTSDHESVSIQLRIDTIPQLKALTKRCVRKWDRLTHEQIFELYTYPVSIALSLTVEHLKLGINSADEIDEYLNTITRILLECAKAIPTSKSRSYCKPYWNDNLSELKRLKISKYKAWCELGRPRDVDSTAWAEHKAAKKAFSGELRRVSRAYENDEVCKAVRDADVDRNVFWRVVKKNRKSARSCVTAIKNDSKKAVYDTGEVLQAWKEHFERLCTPAVDETFDEAHFINVKERVAGYDTMSDSDQFLDTPFNFSEVSAAIDRLHLKKACGFDNISSEQIRYGGPNLICALTYIFNYIATWEYVPTNFRRGTQVPLYKGKNVCTLDRNSYRGITLLTNYNKIFEILLWSRIEPWWYEQGIVSNLQGACRKKQSCVHTAYLLQETVSSALENNRNVFVAYFDVSKAFDTVWTDGMFYKLYQMGIRGRLWRLLYRSYKGFLCRVRIQSQYSGIQ